MKINQLEQYGLPAKWADRLDDDGLTLGRVTGQNRNRYLVQTATEAVTAQVTGRFMNLAFSAEDYPAVGDWVQLRLLAAPAAAAEDPAATTDRAVTCSGVIERLLPRATVFTRRAAGTRSNLQVVAANIDTLFLCMALDGNFNLRRLERYLAVARDSGARPCVVLTKADLAPDLTAQLAAVTATAGDARVIVCDATREAGWEAVAASIVPGQTYAFLGSSGVGKSTLINRLLGQDALATGSIRLQDAHGRHTTTGRQLMLLPGGGIVIDTPGLRELSIVSADLDATFTDVTTLAAQCRFNDCSHTSEPGCAVQAAIATGTLSEQRLRSYRQLQQEQARNVTQRNRARKHAKLDKQAGRKKNKQSAGQKGKKARLD